MIFIIISVLIAIGWCVVLGRLLKTFGKQILQPANRTLLIAVTAGCAANVLELIWLLVE